MDDVPTSEAPRCNTSNRSVTKLLQDNPQLISRTMEDFFERHRDKLLDLAAEELVSCLLRDSHRSSISLPFPELMEKAMEKIEDRSNDFLAAVAQESSRRLFPNSSLGKELFAHIFEYVAKKMNGDGRG